MEAAQFARRLRGSKTMRLGLGNAPPQILTSPHGFLQKDDYGLKQPLPPARRPSPYIQVREMDNEWARPEWRPATDEAFFARKWEESGLTTATSPEKTAIFVTSSPYVASSVPDAEGLASLAKGKQKGAPDFAWLSETDFEHYLDKLRDLQPEFAEFCRKREAAAKAVEADGQPEASTSQLPAETDTVEEERERGRLIVDFINENAASLAESLPPTSKYHHRQRDIQPLPHPVLGLHYAPHSAMHNERFAEPVPGRVLSKHVEDRVKDGFIGEKDADFLQDTANKMRSGYQTSLMGVVSSMSPEHVDRTGVTQWMPESENGRRDAEAGKGWFRVTSATATTKITPRARDRRPTTMSPYAMESTLDEMGGHHAVSRETSSRDWEKFPGVPQKPVQLSLQAVDMESESTRPRVGSAEYVSGRHAPNIKTSGLYFESHRSALDGLSMRRPVRPSLPPWSPDSSPVFKASTFPRRTPEPVEQPKPAGPEDNKSHVSLAEMTARARQPDSARGQYDSTPVLGDGMATPSEMMRLAETWDVPGEANRSLADIQRKQKEEADKPNGDE